MRYCCAASNTRCWRHGVFLIYGFLLERFFYRDRAAAALYMRQQDGGEDRRNETMITLRARSRLPASWRSQSSQAPIQTLEVIFQ